MKKKRYTDKQKLTDKQKKKFLQEAYVSNRYLDQEFKRHISTE